jgi:hypothetical protein
MPKGQHDRRLDILAAARSNGWTAKHESVGDTNDVLFDTFTSDLGVIRCVWVRTPWSSGGRYAGAIFSSVKEKKDINLWKVGDRGPNSLMHTLRSHHP